VKKLMLAATVATTPMAVQADPPPKASVYCNVRLQSDDGVRVMVLTGYTENSQINWIQPQADPLTVSLIYVGGTDSPIAGSAELKLVDKPTAPLTAVFHGPRRSWSISMQAHDYAREGPPDVRASAPIDPTKSDGREVAAAIASAEPLTVSIEGNGSVIYSAALSPSRLATRDRLIAEARAKAASADPAWCKQGPPPLLVPPPPSRPLQ
jgi:hypothetical protein